ncbi:MAG: hypothetical protein KKA65_04310 [Nanoarchaeota archaeon]|nr:hypothetical protein [Nanoarchaeota archaeon]MBU4456698.1 hypothetical protein [Nanoarchaeota archaeon]MCG2719638.1 hypothetical protein [Nanoarchaeota archaeon]
MTEQYKVIDMHTHLRNAIPLHTIIAKENGIDIVVFMANTNPVLDNLDKILETYKMKRYCHAAPVSAITKNLDGKELVDVDRIKYHVVGFSDDGKCLSDLSLLKEVLKKEVLILLHCEPEAEMVKRYLDVLADVNGKMHLQHISLRKSVELIRYAKKSGIKVTCETCPHYFSYTKYDLETKVNPPLAIEDDIFAIREGLVDKTIDVIASDYAPLPRVTGIAGFRSFLPLSYGLVMRGILTEDELKEKLHNNPKKIIESGYYKLG